MCYFTCGGTVVIIGFVTWKGHPKLRRRHLLRFIKRSPEKAKARMKKIWKIPVEMKNIMDLIKQMVSFRQQPRICHIVNEFFFLINRGIHACWPFLCWSWKLIMWLSLFYFPLGPFFHIWGHCVESRIEFSIHRLFVIQSLSFRHLTTNIGNRLSI